MSLSLEGKQLRSAIKRLMKKNGYRYADLAKALKLSIPTIKRMLTRDDLPLERAVSVAHWLGISFSQLVELANQNSSGVALFSEAQENFFIQSPRAFLYFHLLLTGWSKEYILKNFGFTLRESERIQFALEKIGLVEVWPESRLRLKTRAPHRMIPGGKMETIFFDKVVESIFRTIRKRTRGYADAENLSSPTLFRPFEIVMQSKTYLKMARELREVVEKYRAIGVSELQLESREKLKHVSGLIVADFYYSWTEALGDQKTSTRI